MPGVMCILNYIWYHCVRGRAQALGVIIVVVVVVLAQFHYQKKSTSTGTISFVTAVYGLDTRMSSGTWIHTSFH